MHVLSALEREIYWLKEKIENTTPDIHSLCVLACYFLYVEKKPKLALSYAHQSQEFATKLGDSQMPMIEIQLKCHIKLQNKKLALKFLRRYKRYWPKPNEKKRLEFQKFKTLINKIPEAEKKKKKKVLTKTAHQCFDDNCTKIEQSVGEFKYCGKCRIAIYCSRECQVSHWKSFHKFECGKNLFHNS